MPVLRSAGRVEGLQGQTEGCFDTDSDFSNAMSVVAIQSVRSNERRSLGMIVWRVSRRYAAPVEGMRLLFPLAAASIP